MSEQRRIAGPSKTGEQSAFDELRQEIERAFDAYFDAHGIVELDIQDQAEVDPLLGLITQAVWNRYFEGNAMAEVIYKMGELAGREARTDGQRTTRIPARRDPIASRRNEHGRVEFIDTRTGKKIGEQG